ncbi:outer membrane beta-barrel protein [Pseudomonas sp. zfem002]|uniref:outer membrane beta-barrel protein n=1 Tax=Pseudomonas sp. zfem002 TaxID=3078197 RepID=UPI0029288431|nr:outer membrane beta-barrel protein [Pseudomonas sp. zfem002]MDU9392875.1 outer membrane beta-barrel protein [Pseudomonas sp. zfem002]
MHNIKVNVLGAVLGALTIMEGHAAGTQEVGEGSLARELFGERLTRDFGITASGLLDVGYSRNNRSSSSARKGGQSNLPVSGLADEGLEFGSLHLFVDKPLLGTTVPRITPKPGPAPQQADFGFTVEAVYGRNAQNARTYGWDMGWGMNQSDSNKAREDKDLFLAVPNFAATAYLPVAEAGVNVMAGIFGSAFGYEIPPNIRSARNAFASKTYAYMAETGSVAGVLLGTRLLANESMLLGGELGVIQGWKNLRDNNHSKSLMGALRWRTPDMQTWLDYEFVLGNAQNDDFDDVQTPKSRVVSPDDQFRQEHSLTAWHRFDEHWSMGAELLYGHQEGDGKASSIDVVTGPGFDGARWWGGNAVLTYQYRPDLSFSVRGEHFSNPDGYALFPSTTARGDFNAITSGLRWDVNGHLSLRPELRYDWFDARDHGRPFGDGSARSQLTAMVEALVYF